MGHQKTLIEQLSGSLCESIDVYDNCTMGSEERKKEAENVEKIAKALKELKDMESTILDRNERRLIEAERNRENAEIERKKCATPWVRILLETASGLLRQGTAHLLYKDELREVLHFEEHGIIRSKGGKDLRPPRLN